MSRFGQSENLVHRIKRTPWTGATSRHYCRICDRAFQPTPDGGEPPHTTALIHRIKDHRPDERFVRCSRYCDQREQPEEAAAGRQMYGQVVPKHTPAIVFEKGYGALFPDVD